MTPEIAKTYTFVRRKLDGFEHTDFTRHEDGSAGFVANGAAHIFECHPDAWQHALAALAAESFVEMGEARRSGLLPNDWLPTLETSTLASCGPVTVMPVGDDAHR